MKAPSIAGRLAVLLAIFAVLGWACGDGRAIQDGGPGGGNAGGGAGGAMGGTGGGGNLGPVDAAPAGDGALRDVGPSPTIDAGMDAGTDGGICFPACLTDIGIPCPRLGQSCVMSTQANGDVVLCYANGVKALATTGSTTVKQANGDICFRHTIGAGQERDYTDRQGNPVAHFEYTDSSFTRIAVTCADGSMTTVDLTSPECVAYNATMPCSNGSCTW